MNRFSNCLEQRLIISSFKTNVIPRTWIQIHYIRPCLGGFLPTRTLVNMYLIWSTCTLVQSFLFWVKPYLSIKFQESNYVFIFGMWSFHLFIPKYCKSDMPWYGHLEVFSESPQDFEIKGVSYNWTESCTESKSAVFIQICLHIIHSAWL